MDAKINMLNNIIKELHKESEENEVLKLCLSFLTTDKGFGFSNAQLYLFDEEIELLSLEDSKLIREEVFDSKYSLLKKAGREGNNKVTNDGKTVAIKLESQGHAVALLLIDNNKEIRVDDLNLLEIFVMQTGTILDLMKQKKHMEVQVAVKTLELNRVNKELKSMNMNLENIIEERTNEIKSVQTQMIQKEKLASIGQLAAGVAHELNNPIGFVQGNFTALKDYFDIMNENLGLYKKLKEKCLELKVDELNSEIQEVDEFEESSDIDFILEDIDMLFEESEDGLSRVTSIVKNLKEFSRIDDEKSVEFDINRGIKNSLTIASNEYKYCADIITDLGDIPKIKANGGEINEVILNLIVNAAQAIKELNSSEKKTISIKTYRDSKNVICEIEDTGPGVPKAIRERIFDPFFTTKEPGKGTGLGLNIAYDIITNKHTGELILDTEVGRGTKFTIKLPMF